MKFKLGFIGSGIIAVVLAIMFFSSITIIGQGHAGVIYSRADGVKEETLSQGWHFVPFWKRVTEYPVSTETVKVNEFSVQTKDGKPLKVELSYDYANELEKLPYIYNKFKGQKSEVIQEGWLQTRVKKATLNVFSSYSVLEVFQHQGKINAEIEASMRKLVQQHGFMVDSVTLGSPTPDKQTAKAIQQVVDASQKLEKIEIEKKQSKALAEKRTIDAQGIADADIIEAEGKAKANETLNKSLTDKIIKHEYIKKWDGKEPTTKVNGEAGVMISK